MHRHAVIRPIRNIALGGKRRRSLQTDIWSPYPSLDVDLHSQKLSLMLLERRASLKLYRPQQHREQEIVLDLIG